MVGATNIHIDNQAAISLSRNPEFHRRTKHVGIRYHRVRQEQELGTANVVYVPTEKNVSDILTKGVTACVLDRILPMIGLGH